MKIIKTLRAFLQQKTESLRFAVSQRFTDDNGSPQAWVIEAITAEQDELIRKSCKQPLNPEEYKAKLCTACVKYPDLQNSELQDSYGVMGEENLLKAMLLAGEYMNLVAKVQEVCGFTKRREELECEAKN